jgi:hypothetical protein
MACLETELTSIFKSLEARLAPHFKESEKIVEGSKLVCVESPEIFASSLVLLGLDKNIPKILQALHFVSQRNYGKPYDPSEKIIDQVLSHLRDWVPQRKVMVDRGYPNITWNLVRTSQVIARSLCIAIESGCLAEIVPLEHKIVLYHELSNQNEDSTLWMFCGSEEIMARAAAWLVEHTTPELKTWHQDLRHRFEKKSDSTLDSGISMSAYEDVVTKIV